MSKKAVIFDMDGVIIDSEPFWQEAQIETLAGLGVVVTRQDCEQLTMGKRIDEIVRIWCKTHPVSIPTSELEAMILTKLCDRIFQTGEALKGVYSALEYFSKKKLKNSGRILGAS